MARIRGKLEKAGQVVMHYSKCYNSKYVNFVGYDTCGTLIWTPGEGSINTNKISRQGSPKTRINKVSTSSTMGYDCSQHKDTC